MRILTAVSILAMFSALQAAQAQGQPARTSTPPAPAAKVFTEEESTAMAEASRKRVEAAQRSRDERLRKATQGTCIGC
jgi:hypothetical protein